MAVASISDVLDIERIPLEERNIPRTTYEMLMAGAAIAPDAPALTFLADAKQLQMTTVWSHRQLFRRITQAANLFRRLGVERGDAVAFILPNLPETHLAIWGGEAAGIAFAINPLQELAQMAALMKAVEPKLLVTLAPTLGFDLWAKATAAAAGLTQLRAILAVDMSPYGAPRATAPGLTTPRAVPILDFDRELRRENGEELDFEPPGGRDLSSFFCTGGTTGAPKIAKRTHFSESFDCWALTKFFEGRIGSDQTIFCGLPLFHVNGQLVTGLAPWSVGAHVVIGAPQGYRGDGVIESFWSIVERFRITMFSGVPTVYSALLNVPIAGRDISSLEVGLCGAAPMPTHLFKTFQDATGVRIVEGYGLTEGACVSSGNPPAAAPRIGSIGVRYPYQEMRALVLDADGAYLRDAAVDEIGIIAIRGPNVFAGYLDPQHEKGCWIERRGEVWLNTGDLGRQDADGFFWLTGRKKDLIIRGGHNIDPMLIEGPLHRHPDVAMAAAVGRPDPHAGDVPVAYVQLKGGAQATPAALLEFAQAHIPERAAWPKAVRVVDKLPTTNVGKIFKPELHRLEIADVIRAEATAAGAALMEVSFRQDPARGLTAVARVSHGGAKLEDALSKYAFAVEVCA